MNQYEEFAHWGDDDRLPFEPRRFRFKSLALYVSPVPALLQRRMLFDQCIELEASVVYDWFSQRVGETTTADLKALLDMAVASGLWTVAYESDREGETCELAVEPADLFDCVDRLLRGETEAALTIVKAHDRS